MPADMSAPIEKDLLDPNFRKNLIAEIENNDNRKRMEKSLQDCDVYGGEIKPYVEKYLTTRFSLTTVSEMPVVSSVNLTKKIIDQKASLYRNPPVRVVPDASEGQEQAIKAIYRDMMANTKFLASNRYFELQRQNHAIVVPKGGQLTMRAIKQHQLNVVPSRVNPEKGEIYILSSFDKQMSRIKEQETDNIDQDIADEEDYKSRAKTYIVWSPSYHFVMDGNGNIISTNESGEIEMDNPISPIIPIVEVAGDKDFEYFIKGGSEISQFTVEYNGALSSLGHIVDMQGFAQAYLKAPQNLQPQSVQIGPNYILRLITDPNSDADVDFGFANPGADLSGAQSYVESLLAQFLSSQGLDPNTVVGNASAQTGFTSGVERLLALVEKFEASKDVMSLYEKAEQDIFKVIKAWHNELKGTELLDPKYVAEDMSDDMDIVVVFEKPEAVQTEDERLTIIERKMDMELASRIDGLMILENLDRDEAIERAKEIDQDMGFSSNGETTERDEANEE